MRLIYSLLLLFLIQSLSTLAYSKPLLLKSDQEQYTLASYIELLEDKDGDLTIEEISSSNLSHRFFQNQSATPNLGYTDSAYWVRFTLINASEKEMNWFLELDYPTTNYVDFYTPTPDGTFDKQSTGDQYPFSHRKFEIRNFLFSLTIPPQATLNYYIRVKSTAIILPLKLWQATALNHKTLIQYTLLGIYFGGLLIIAIFNLFIFTSVNENVYLYYVLYTLGFALTESSLNGTAFQFLWPNQIWLANRMIVLGGGFTVFWGFQFSRTFIDTPYYTPRLDKVLRFGMGLTIASMMVSLFNYSLGNQLISFIVLVTIPLLLVAGYICLKKGSYTARYYVLAWVLVVSGVIIHLLKTFGFLPANIFTNWADELGSLAEVSLLSFGLAARINQMKRAEKEKAQELYLKNKELEENNQKLKEYESSLEQKIFDRTQELNLKNEILNNALDEVKSSNLKYKAAKDKAESADRAKSEFLSNISHELRTPMQGVLGFAKLGFERIDIVGPKKLTEYFSTIHTSGMRLLTLINDLLDLSRMEAGKTTYDFKDDKLSRLTNVVIQELETLIDEKHSRITLKFPEHENTVCLDESKIIQVIRNFLSNAIKFSPANSKISIEASEQFDSSIYSIYDQGVGIPEEELLSIFDKFSQSSRTKNKAGGTGLGLAICKEIIKNHQGSIWAENYPDGGSAFHFKIVKPLID
jgi:signal transduction histidine kinase